MADMRVVQSTHADGSGGDWSCLPDALAECRRRFMAGEVTDQEIEYDGLLITVSPELSWPEGRLR